MKNKPSIPKGMRDFNSDEMQKRNYIFETVKTAFECYAYAPIATPAMESISTLSNKYGGEGDRLIFNVLNSGDYLSKTSLESNITSKDLTKEISEKALRYDLTVPFARFVAQNRDKIVFPFRRYQMQNVWRADRPQRGRYREFFQCDADVIGTESLLCEVELIQIYDEVFSSLKIPNIDIRINNRKVLSGMVELMGELELFNTIVVTLDKLDNIGLDRVKKELLSKGVNSKSLPILETFLNAKSITDLSSLLKKTEIGSIGLDELNFVIDNISKLGLRSTNLVFDLSLARGLDYYTGCIFEVKVNDVKIGSVGGGGRYDDLTSNFSLQDVSGVGISFGIDRIYLVMSDLDLFPKDIGTNTKLMFVNFGIEEANFCLPLLKELRAKGFSSELYPDSAKIKKQMNYANNKNIQFVILIGKDEMESGLLTVKDMFSGEQVRLNLSELISML